MSTSPRRSSSSAEAKKPDGRKRRRHNIDDEDFLYVPDKDKPTKLIHIDTKDERIQKYLNMTKPELQRWLRHNGQLVTGRRYDLLLRCVDGEINGRITGCPKCHKGQMFYDYNEGNYVCNGYFDGLAQTPIHCGNTLDNIPRDRWHDIEKDPAIEKGEGRKEDLEEAKHHRDHPQHQHHEHNCKIEANHPFVDLLEDMAYYHSILKDDGWGYKARAFISAARAVEHLPFEIDGKVHDALSLGDSRGPNHVEKIGKTTSEVMQAFLDSGKTRSPHLEDLKDAAAKKRASLKENPGSDEDDGKKKSKETTKAHRKTE